MKKSLFFRYFSICCSMILLCIIIIGFVLTISSINYFTNDKYVLLKQNAEHASAITASNMVVVGGNYVVPPEIVSSYKILSDAINAEIFLTDLSGKTIICSTPECLHPGNDVAAEILQSVAEESVYTEMGWLSGIYTERRYSVGVPVYSGGNMIGAVFASTSAVSLNNFFYRIIKMFSLSSLFVMAVTFVIIYFVTNRLTKPLRDMVSAIQSFSDGDFSRRVPVSNTDEIGKLAISFNSMASSLTTLESVRRSFIANVSHELKTPMTTIGGFVDGILDHTIPEEKQCYYLSIVSAEIKRLSRVVVSMLNIAHIEAGERSMNITQFDLNDLVCRTLFYFERRIEDKKLDIKGLDVNKIMVDADRDLINQVIYNLIDNAVKFANEDGYIEFNYYAEGPLTYASIKNSGEGIFKDDLEKVFERFYKTDKSRSLDKNGVGLGLHIVRSIINLHGGEITVHSAEGEYCEFVFTLPTGRKKGVEN